MKKVYYLSFNGLLKDRYEKGTLPFFKFISWHTGHRKHEVLLVEMGQECKLKGKSPSETLFYWPWASKI